MSMQGRIGRAGGSKVKRALGVQAALEWAFRVEQAQLELPPPKDVTEEGFGFGLEYVLLQRVAPRCKVDGGRHKMGGYTHADAEVIAATVAGLSDRLGGKRIAIYVAELARAGMTPVGCPASCRAACRSRPRQPPRWWLASSVCCIAGAGAAWKCWLARSPGGRIPSRSPPPGTAMRIGGRRWIGCGMGCSQLG